jgi:hypothetical protein
VNGVGGEGWRWRSILVVECRETGGGGGAAVTLDGRLALVVS